MRMRPTLVMTLVAAGLPAPPQPAAAYVRTMTESGVATAWKTPCVTMEFSLGAPPPELDAQGYLSAAQAAGAAWSQASLDVINRCTNVIFAVVSVPDVAGKIGLDYHNRLIFRQGQWCSDPLPKDGSCYDPSALALTSVFQNTDTGEILDADLEVNATDFTWGDYVAHPEESDAQDFQGAMTHEFGHVIGLSHTCFSPGGTFADGTLIPRPTDNQGNPVPDCNAGNLPPIITQATMYVSVSAATPGAEVDLRSLSPDDMQAACDIYLFATNFECVAPSRLGSTSDGGCSYPGPTGRDSVAGVLAILALGLAFRRRRQ
jgi:MYXO-CTERM domain-containing protein